MVRGLRVLSRPSARRKKRLAACLSRLALSRKSIGLAGAVDGAIEVAPLPVDPEVGLVDVPRPTARPQVPAHALLELRGEALDPAVHGRVVDHDPAIGRACARGRGS